MCGWVIGINFYFCFTPVKLECRSEFGVQYLRNSNIYVLAIHGSFVDDLHRYDTLGKSNAIPKLTENRYVFL